MSSLTYSHLSGSIVIDGSISASGGFSGSVPSASYASTASYAEVNSSTVDHDATLNFVALEHIDHSAVSVNPGQGLTGGGTIQTDRSLALDGSSGYFTSSVKNVIETNDYALVQFNTASFATTGSNTFTGNQTISGNILPTTTDTYDLGASGSQWRDLFLSSGSLYINGVQVLSTDGSDMLIQTDGGESFKILETANDTITLETADGDITLTTSGTGNIELDSPVQVAAGNKILSSDGNGVHFGHDLIVTGSISSTGLLTVTGTGTSQFSSHLQSHCLGIGTTPSGVAGEIRATGDITAFYSSDERLKDNITPIENSVEKLKQIKGVEFDWIEKEGVHSYEGHDVGVIAQDIEKVLPELVMTRENGFKAVKYDKLVALLIQANKELIERIEKLENK